MADAANNRDAAMPTNAQSNALALREPARRVPLAEARLLGLVRRAVPILPLVWASQVTTTEIGLWVGALLYGVMLARDYRIGSLVKPFDVTAIVILGSLALVNLGPNGGLPQ
jgi:hypothetical protein